MPLKQDVWTNITAYCVACLITCGTGSSKCRMQLPGWSATLDALFASLPPYLAPEATNKYTKFTLKALTALAPAYITELLNLKTDSWYNLRSSDNIIIILTRVLQHPNVGTLFYVLIELLYDSVVQLCYPVVPLCCLYTKLCASVEPLCCVVVLLWNSYLKCSIILLFWPNVQLSTSVVLCMFYVIMCDYWLIATLILSTPV